MRLPAARLPALFEQSPLFRGLPPDRLAQLVATTRTQNYARGELIVQKGDRPTTMLLIAAGKIKETLHGADGRERIIELLGPGQTCGEAALLLDSPYPFCVASLTNCQLLHVEAGMVHTLIDSVPSFTRRLLHAISLRMYTLRCDLEALSLHSPPQRIARFLIELHDASTSTTPVVALPFTKAVLASRLGMSPESLSRALRDLADCGLIEMHGQRITLNDTTRLRELIP